MDIYVVPNIKSYTSYEFVEFLGYLKTESYLNFNVYNGLSFNNTAEYRCCQLDNNQSLNAKIINLKEGSENV